MYGIKFRVGKTYTCTRASDNKACSVARSGKNWAVTVTGGKNFVVSDRAELQQRFGKLRSMVEH